MHKTQNKKFNYKFFAHGAACLALLCSSIGAFASCDSTWSLVQNGVPFIAGNKDNINGNHAACLSPGAGQNITIKCRAAPGQGYITIYISSINTTPKVSEVKVLPGPFTIIATFTNSSSIIFGTSGDEGANLICTWN